jgi:cation diffusion facilitator family transporter
MGLDDSSATVNKARRTAAMAGGVTLALAAAKGLIGALSGSSALLADALHSVSDFLSLGASWFGLKLASRKPSDRFPYGFYRAETLAALAVSAIILYLGIRLLIEGATHLTTTSSQSHSYAAMLTALASAIAAFFVSRWEGRVSRSTGSQSLGAIADEARIDIATSLLVFVAVAATKYQVAYVEGIVTIGISCVVLAVGLRNAQGAILGLMDASVDPELEAEVSQLIAGIPQVRRVESMHARRAGPFYFVEGNVHVTGSMDVTRSHALSHEAQRLVRRTKPQVEGLILHIEPFHKEVKRVLIPVESSEGTAARVSKHFGRAECLLLADVRDSTVERTEFQDNPFAEKRVRAGLAVIRRLLEKTRVDAAIVREIGEIAFYALRDNYVEVFQASEVSAGEALAEYAAGKLVPLNLPTHSSDDKL